MHPAACAEARRVNRLPVGIEVQTEVVETENTEVDRYSMWCRGNNVTIVITRTLLCKHATIECTDTQSVTTSTASNRANLPPVAAISPGIN